MDWNAVLSGLSMLWSWDCFICLLIGVIGGMIVGILPGFGAMMAISILLPITYGMNSSAALVMLTAIYASAIYGGSITATLCHTPGTNASAATAIDGFELTRQGRGMEAVGVCTLASGIGGIAGALALLFIAPPLGKFSLKFSCLEYFLLAVFGLTVISAVVGKNVWKGLTSAALGVLFGTVGIDAITMYPRYTFHILRLEDGFNFIPALIGLFTISQLMIMATEVKRGQRAIVIDESNLGNRRLPPWKELKSCFPTIIRSSIIGVIIGIVPAAGAGISSWVNYSLGQRFSKHPEKFGHGSFEGVASAETGNNAACGGALIPMITLGLPGSGVAAILLGGMMLHGLTPGPKMFNQYAPTTYSIIIGYLFTNVLMLVIGMFIAKYVARVAQAPMAVLAPVVGCLCLVGTFAINNSMFDVVLCLIFGLLGYAMKKHDFATAPMVLGMILSDICEDNWRRAVILSRGDMMGYFLRRPIAIILALCIITSLLLPFISNIIKKSRAKKVAAKVEA